MRKLNKKKSKVEHKRDGERGTIITSSQLRELIEKILSTFLYYVLKRCKIGSFNMFSIFREELTSRQHNFIYPFS